MYKELEKSIMLGVLFAFVKYFPLTWFWLNRIICGVHDVHDDRYDHDDRGCCGLDVVFK